MSFIANSGKNIGRTAVVAKDWIVKNPKTSAGVAAVPAVAVMAAPLALGAAGFTAGGVAAGSAAAGIQAGIGNVVAGSLFATLQSAGAGGAALGLVQGVAGGTAAAISGGTAYILMRGARNGNDDEAAEVVKESKAVKDAAAVENKDKATL